MSCSHDKSWVNLQTWLLIGCSLLCSCDQEPAGLLTQLLTITTITKFPSLGVVAGRGGGLGRLVGRGRGPGAAVVGPDDLQLTAEAQLQVVEAGSKSRPGGHGFL